MVSSLVDSYPQRLALVEYHVNPDGYDTPWGQERADDFYSAAGAIPFMVYDGGYEWPPEDFGYGLHERLDGTTDVSIALAGAEVGSAQYQIAATVCVEPDGRGKQMRIYTVQLLDHYPNPPSHSRNCFRQAAAPSDVEVDAGSCATVTSTFTFDGDSLGDPDDIKIVAWAQQPGDVWPAYVYQAAQMQWPFTSPEPAEPELPREVSLSLPLFAAPGSAWVESATAAAALPESDLQIRATYRVLCGDLADLLPLDHPPLSPSPFPVVLSDDGSIPIFAAGSGMQEVLLCDYHGNRSYPNPKWGVSTEGGPVQVPTCDGTVRPAGPGGVDADGRLVLFDPATDTEYDFWQATTDRQGECQSRGAARPGDSILEAGQADLFDVRGEGADPAGVSGARASGIPLLAGLILPEDVASGVIAHALAVAIPGPRNLSPDPSNPLPSDVVYPAAGTETTTYSTNPDALACGQRLRLKTALFDGSGRPVNESAVLAPITRMVVEALRTYGAYVVGTAPSLTFYAEDVHTAELDLSDDDIDRLIGQPVGMPLPSGKTRWQVVVDALDQELADLPFAYGTCSGASSTVLTPNFEVVEPAAAACTPPVISSQPEGVTIASGSSATLEVVATGSGPLAYQWYEGPSGSTAAPVAGATSASYATPPLTGSTSYWVRVSNECGSVDSAAATVTVTTTGLRRVRGRRHLG